MTSANRTASSGMPARVLNYLLSPECRALQAKHDEALQDLVSNVLETKKPSTFNALLDQVDCGPSRARAAIYALRASGHKIRLAGM